MEEERRLKLVGYYPSADRGFVMPLFGRAQGANNVFLARCLITGGRHGTITSFEAVEVDDQRRLPPDDFIEIEIGQTWRDVFLWNGAVFVGTPDQIWSELTSFHADLEARAPLSLLDLAVHAGRPEASRLAPVAMNFLTERFGAPQADGWRCQFLRLHTELRLREALADVKLSDAEFRLVRLSGMSGELRLELPRALTDALEASGKGQDSVEDIAKLAAMLGATLIPPASIDLASRQNGGTSISSTEHYPTTETSPSQLEQREVRPSTSGLGGPESRDPGTVAILPLGKRASAVTGHLRSARNHDAWSGGDRLDLMTDEDNLTSDGTNPEILVLIIDDEYLENGSLPPNVEEFLTDRVSGGSLVLIAPALPSNGPSTLLEARLVDHFLAHAIVDTAVARSPFWWGQAKRSFDRRIADVVQLAITAGKNQGLRRELMQRRHDDILPVLSLGLLPEKPSKNEQFGGPGNLRLGSESSWVDSNPKRNDPDIFFSIRMSSDGRDLEPHDDRLIAEGRRPTNRFPEFASRLLTTVIEKGRRDAGSGKSSRLEQWQAPPAQLSQHMKTPSHAASFTIEREYPEEANVQMVVTAETPNLDLIETANRLGWSVARYTDTASLRRFIGGRSANGSFADEIDIGPIQSVEAHRRLATRGVDQRDVFRVSADLVAETLESLSPDERSVAREHGRLRRSAAAAFSESNQDYLFKSDFFQSHHPAAEKLRVAASINGTRGGQRQTRRQADMQKCWMPPAEGLQRYALVDGAVPPILVRLHENEVPVEDFFFIDGDLAVSALFRSRPFAVWARATLPAASSWMARFSLIYTFGGFPIVQPFRLEAEPHGRMTLTLDDTSFPIIDLALAVENHIDRAQSSQGLSSWREAHKAIHDLPEMQRLNEVILNAYELPGDADDITVLRRLLELNAKQT